MIEKHLGIIIITAVITAFVIHVIASILNI